MASFDHFVFTCFEAKNKIEGSKYFFTNQYTCNFARSEKTRITWNKRSVYQDFYLSPGRLHIFLHSQHFTPTQDSIALHSIGN